MAKVIWRPKEGNNTNNVVQKLHGSSINQTIHVWIQNLGQSRQVQENPSTAFL